MRSCLAAATLAVATLTSAPAAAQMNSSDEARALMRAAAEALASAPAFSVDTDITYDVVLQSGQTVTMFTTQHALLRRPNGFRMTAALGDGTHRDIVFTGSQVVMSEPDLGLYAHAPAGPTLDAALDFATDTLHAQPPLAMLLRADLPARLDSVFTEAAFLGVHMADGVRQNHLWLSNDAVDVQVWIAAEGRPQLGRLSVIYKSAPGAPRFAARFANWNYAPEIGADAFAFTPADGAEAIEILDLQGGAQP